MKDRVIDTQEASNKWWAARDARMRAAAMWSHYSSAQRTRAERMVLGLGMVYSAKGIHINPRQKFITIKVDGAQVKDNKTLALLEKDYEAEGITKVVSAQGIIYRIPKA
jgi:hypothetical protein